MSEQKTPADSPEASSAEAPAEISIQSIPEYVDELVTRAR